MHILASLLADLKYTNNFVYQYLLMPPAGKMLITHVVVFVLVKHILSKCLNTYHDIPVHCTNGTWESPENF